MKKLLSIAAIAGASLFAFAPSEAEAGYRSKTIGHCGHCGKSVYSYYRPVRLACGSVRYTWVPSYHTGCRSRSSYHSYRSSPSISIRSYRTSPRYHSYRYSRGPSISFSFGSSRYCR